LFGERGVFRLIIKAIVRLFTGKCEIERILVSTSFYEVGHHQQQNQQYQVTNMTISIRKCLSKSKKLVQECSYLDIPNSYRNSSHDIPSNYDITNPFEKERIVQSIVEKKNIYSAGSREKLNVVATQLISVKEGIKDLKLLSKIQFSHQNPEHENMLLNLWENVYPGRAEVEILDRNWSLLGFQGKDPQTDFRGMGLLGLINLLKFTERRNDLIQRIMTQYCDQNQDPLRSLPFAITGINVTSMTLELVETRKFDLIFIRLLNTLPRNTTSKNNADKKTKIYDSIYLESFQRVYDKVFSMLLREWANKMPENIMKFREIKGDCLKKVNDMLDGLTDASEQTVIDFFSGMTVRRDLEIDEVLN